MLPKEQNHRNNPSVFLLPMFCRNDLLAFHNRLSHFVTRLSKLSLELICALNGLGFFFRVLIFFIQFI